MTKGDSILMKGEKRKGLYVLFGSYIPASTAMTVESNIDKTKLWHLRLGHISVKG